MHSAAKHDFRELAADELRDGRGRFGAARRTRPRRAPASAEAGVTREARDSPALAACAVRLGVRQDPQVGRRRARALQDVHDLRVALVCSSSRPLLSALLFLFVSLRSLGFTVFAVSR